MSSRPDTLVARHGETVTLERVTDYDLDANGQVDPNSLAWEQVSIRAVVSQPSETDERRLDGRLSTGGLRLTVDSGTDIESQRGGHPDRIVRNGQVYQVEEVRDDRNPLTGTQKRTVLVDRLGGERPLPEPGETESTAFDFGFDAGFS